jgi:pimeloyl-ACP methyl ester carboxylesterase
MQAMKPRYNARVTGALGFSAAAAALAAGATDRLHRRWIAADPENAILSRPPVGRPLTAISADRTRIHAEAFGPEDAPTIVLIHGWTEDLTFWTYQIRALSNDFRVVAYDLRGHAHSERPATRDYSLDRFGEDLEAILTTCVPDGEQAVVAGHSLGAMSIAAWAERHDVGRASAAALMNTGVGDLLGQHLLVRLPHWATALRDPLGRRGFLGNRSSIPRYSTPIHHAAIKYVAFGRDASPAQVAFYERMLFDCDPGVRAGVGIAMSRMELHHALANLTVPTLVMAGADDKLTPPYHARRIGSLLPNLTKVIEVPGLGHMGPIERPEEFSSALHELAMSVRSPVHAEAA